MPELPEVETVVRGLRADVLQRTITGFESTWPSQLNLPDPQDFAARLCGQRIEGLGRRGKYIVFTLTHDYLLIHLKMSGRLYMLDDAGGDKWVRARFPLDDGRTLTFSDARKFGRIYLTANLEEVTGHLGPEPLEDTFTLQAFAEQLSGRTGTIKPLLLNQSFVAGVGNIYADEALWRAHIDPRRKANTLTKEEIAALFAGIRTALSNGITDEGASINWYRKPDGTTGGAQNRFRVYDREGEPCYRCGAPIEKIRLGQRGTHFCPTCQH